jgi:pimeloyl-ACP methyl ester carboxylesterase
MVCIVPARGPAAGGWMRGMARETFQAPVDGGVLGGYVDGAGPPVLVLHGGPGLSVTTVDGLVADLVPAYRVATFQQRGIEPSLLDGAFTIDEAVADVGAVLDHLGWEQAYVLGFSWGGHLAFWVAARLPGRLLGVLSVDPLGAVGDGGNAAFEAEMAARTPPADRDRAAELDRLAQHGDVSEELALESLRLFWPAYFADPSTAPAMREPMRLSIPAYAGLFGDLVARLPELEASLPSITVPLGVVVGDRSPMPSSAGRDSAERIPGAWTEVVEGAGHMTWHERPGAVRQALDRLADHSSASTA